jgi:hypothetical protein
VVVVTGHLNTSPRTPVSCAAAPESDAGAAPGAGRGQTGLGALLGSGLSRRLTLEPSSQEGVVSFSSAPTQAFRPPDQPRGWHNDGDLWFWSPDSAQRMATVRHPRPGVPAGACAQEAAGTSWACPQTWRSEAQRLWYSAISANTPNTLAVGGGGIEPIFSPERGRPTGGSGD